MRILKQLATVLLLSGATASASAAIIDNDTYLSDTETGLDWLDVTVSVNMSYDYVSSQFGTGGEFDGWRYATGDEFVELLEGWTGVTSNGYGLTYTESSSRSVDGLVTLLGSTLDSYYVEIFGQTYDERAGLIEGEGIDYTLGLIADLDDSGTLYRRAAYIYDRDDNIGGYYDDDYYRAHNSSIPDDNESYHFGSFLVRDTLVASVPEPSSIALLGLGLCGLRFARKKKKA